MAADRTLVYEFVSEAKEHLANVADDLLALEQGKDDATRYRVDRLFRAVHSVKGGAGFFGCRAVEMLAHAMETVLEPLRHRDGPPSAAVVDALLAGADRIQALLDDVEHSADADVSGPLARLHPFFPPDDAAPAPPPAGRALAVAAPPPAAVLAARPPGHAWLYRARVNLTDCHRRHGLKPLAVVRRFEAAGAVLDAGLEAPDGGLEQPFPPGDSLVLGAGGGGAATRGFRRPARAGRGRGRGGGARPAAPEPAPAPAPADGEAAGARAAERTNTLRIPVGLVDELMTLAGELVLVRNQTLLAIPAPGRRACGRSSSGSTPSPAACRTPSCGRGCSRSGTCSASSRAWSATWPGSWARRSSWRSPGPRWSWTRPSSKRCPTRSRT